MKSIAKISFFNIIYVLLNVIFPLITSMIVSRVIMPEGVGNVSYVQTFVSYFIVLASLGLPIYGIRVIAKCNESRNELSKTFSELFLINIILSCLSSFLFILSLFFVKSVANDVALYIACGIQLFFNFINIDWFYKAKEDYGYIVVRSIIVKILSLVAIIIFVTRKNDYIIYALISSFALVGNNLFNIIRVKKYVDVTFKNISLMHHIKPIVIFGFTVFFATIYNKIDITMIGILSDNINVGLYSNAHKTVNLVLSVTTAITAVFLPRLSLIIAKNDGNELQKILKQGAEIISAIALPASVGLFFLAPQIVVLLFGSSFAGAASSLQWFCLLIIINSFGDLYCYQLVVASSYEKIRLIINIIGTVLNIIGNYFLIPYLGLIGATISSIFTELFINTTLFVIMKKKTHFSFPIKSFIKSFISAVFMGGIIFIILTIKISMLLNTIVAVIIGIISYIFCSIIIKNGAVTNLLKSIFKSSKFKIN